MPKSPPPRKRLCFVTVGATASFVGMIQAVLEDRFLKKLSSLGYTHLRIQYGQDGKSAVADCLGLEQVTTDRLGNFAGIEVDGFEFKDEIVSDMAEAKGNADLEGVVITHGGTGSILAAQRLDALMIVVPNSSLLHNHQEELVKELAKQGDVIHGDLSDLPAALDAVQTLRRTKKVRRSARGVMDIVDEEMGFID